MESSFLLRPETSARIKMRRFSFLRVLDSPDRSELRISCTTAQRQLHGRVYPHYWRLRDKDTHSQPSTLVSLESVKVAGDSLNRIQVIHLHIDDLILSTQTFFFLYVATPGHLWMVVRR